MARPQNVRGEAFRGWHVRLDTTHGQSRAHRGELRELGIRLRRSWGGRWPSGRADVCHNPLESAQEAPYFVTHTQRPVREKETQHKHHNTELHRTSALHACASPARACSVTHSFIHSDSAQSAS